MKNRNADYKLLNKVKNFEPSNASVVGTCANLQYGLDESLYDKVSAPMLLARLCSLFEHLKIDVHGQSGYKITWNIVLKHTPTGHIVTFYDYKGGASWGSDVISVKDAPKEFIQDLKKLLKVLTNERCPHPYDGCVVGEVA